MYNTLDSHKVIAEYLQQVWKNTLGINIQLQNLEWATFLEDRKTSAMELGRAGWIADYADAQNFLDLLITNGGKTDTEEPAATLETTGTVERIATAVIEGNSHFYITLKDDKRIYDCAMPGIIDILQVAKGDKVKLVFVEATPISSVSKLERLQ
jgi:ABC-type transport system substrate-binding protein